MMLPGSVVTLTYNTDDSIEKPGGKRLTNISHVEPVNLLFKGKKENIS